MTKISIIVPVHNSEAYLHKCVDSLLAQTLKEIEIILVDDCSTDSSAAILAEYGRKFPEKVVCLYLEKNLRQGGARNRGMDVAKGEYIAFVDSDDFIEPDMCRVMYQTAQGADMCGADYFIDYGDKIRRYELSYGPGREMTRERRLRLIQRGYFVSRIYRRDFLQKYALRFPEGVFYEDAYFNFMTALCAQSCEKAPGSYYHYYQSSVSTVRSPG